ncbi:MAG: lysine--tRNA ligase [Candidatus Micrarchaeia archaeon]
MDMENEDARNAGDHIKNMHWSEIIASRIRAERKPPYVVMSGITPSGPVHPGTLCEFMFAYAIAKMLGQYGDVRFVFVSDDLDAVDSVPEPLKEYASVIQEDMGLPLALARDPKGCHTSFADHFISETKEIMGIFGVEVEFLRASELYARGLYDEYAKTLCERKDEVKEIVRQSSLREAMPDDWFPIMPLCTNCRNIDKNVVEWYAGGKYGYRCSKCGYKGENAISDHKYKLLFRLDWPTRQKFMNVAVEGGSVDHHTRGGTISTLVEVHRKIYNEEPPYMYKFGLLKYKGKKYSKSKGIGHTVSDLLRLAPVELIKYMLLKPDVQEDKELVIDKDTLFPLLDDYKRASEAAAQESGGMHRADHKKAIAFRLCNAKYVWKAEPSDMILYYNVYGDWEKVAQVTGDPQGVAMLSKYIEEWIRRDLIPDRYMFKVSLKGGNPPLVRAYAEKMRADMGAEDLHNLVFEVAGENGVDSREVFKQLYLAIIGKEMGPRLGKLIYAIGAGRVRQALLS